MQPVDPDTSVDFPLQPVNPNSPVGEATANAESWSLRARVLVALKSIIYLCTEINIFNNQQAVEESGGLASLCGHEWLALVLEDGHSRAITPAGRARRAFESRQIPD